MKTRIPLLDRSLLVLYTILISVLYVPSIGLAMEPIGTIGQPVPEKHAFLPNGNILRAVLSHIQVIDTDTGAVIDEFGERADISDVVFSPTTEYLAILNYDSDSRITHINIWNIEARERITEWEIPARIDVAAFSPIDPLFAISFNDEIHLWNWQIEAFRGKMIGQRRPWERCHSSGDGGTTCSSRPRDHASVFTPDGRYLIVTSARPGIELWDVKTRQLERHFEGHTGNWVEGVAISPNGTHIATYEKDGNEVYVWDVDTQQLLWQEESGISGISDVVFSPDNRHLYVAAQTGTLNRSGGRPWEGWDDHVRVRDVKSGQQMDTFGSEFRILKEITLSPDGKTMLLYYWDAVVLWDLATKIVNSEKPATKKQLRIWVDFVYGWDNVLSPDGRTFVSSSGYFIKTWDIPSQQMQLLVSAEGELFREFAISPDGERLAIGKDPWFEVRDLQTGKVETEFRHIYGIADSAFSASGRWLAVEDWGYILIFDLDNPATAQKLVPPNRTNAISTDWITFCGNDEYLIAADRVNSNQRILLWRRADNKFVFQRMWHIPLFYRSSGSSLRLNPDGSILLALSQEGELQIWILTPTTIELVATLPGVGFPAHFSSDGRYLFTNRDDSLQIWDWQTETPLEHSSIPKYFDISQDRSVLTSYAETGQIQIWDGKALLPSQPVAVEPGGKQIVIFGEVKRNQLLQNFPNPFNPETWIPFRLANESHVTIYIYNTAGQLVRRLSLGTMPAGDYSSQSQAVHWDGRNNNGESVSSGVYLYTIHAGDFSAIRKMLIRK